ncbi:asparagine synthetase B family protein [Quisquiliibacterium transsilvanicum]|uniref:asparagine synthase (glutamine-hydrolyzing) n=1 Tax=Quisquiliibacterium transsilvanicum TaxID=1549638 RepID=A0A7W8M7J5_9BURK|nr:asparagine synthase-related protein [Quisquiliibacterium transsilvanicum]MBB5270029.1 asparagine synthase (glutamine-hydrolyzing) [Quisquiliibacterium transsilvanicum]
MTGTALPFFEGAFDIGRGGAATLEAGGSQALRHDAQDVQVLAFGRIHLKDAGLAALEREQGLGVALAEGWRRHGAELPAQVSGEYLLAAWCPAERRGLVAVDRFSTYSLFFAERDGRLAFSTRPGQVCALLQMPAELDSRSVHAFVHFHMIPAPMSIYRGVRRLDVAEGVFVADGKAVARRHWTPVFVEDRPFDFEREKAAFMAALREGVAQAIEGVPREKLGCFLSGGTDSSTIAGLVTEAYGAPARTFSIGFDVSGYDESHYARIAAKRFGTQHTEYVLTPEDAEKGLDVLARTYEQPFGNSSAVPSYFCARIAHDAGVERMLGGDGGDELYGGNERYAMQWLFSLYGHLPGALRTGVMEPLLLGPLRNTEFWPVRKARGYVEQARVPLPDRLGSKYNLLTRFGAQNVFTEQLLAGAGGYDPVSTEREVWRACDAGSQVNRLLAYDFKFTLGDNDLVKVTRMCHAAGVEVSFPMLCDALTDHSLLLRPDQKLHRTKLRWFFKNALRGFLPDEIIEKTKHGFGMPFGDWLLLQPRLAARAGGALEALADRGMIRRSFLDELNAAVRSGHAGFYGTMVWVLMMLELWLEASHDR